MDGIVLALPLQCQPALQECRHNLHRWMIVVGVGVVVVVGGGVVIPLLPRETIAMAIAGNLGQYPSDGRMVEIIWVRLMFILSILMLRKLHLIEIQNSSIPRRVGKIKCRHQ